MTALLVPEGEMVPVGTPISRIGDPSEKAADAPAAPAPREIGEIDLSNPAASGGDEGESLVGRNKADRGPIRRPRKGSATPSTEAAAATQMQVQGAFAPGGAQSQDVVESDEPAVPAPPATEEPAPPRPELRALAKPPVRKLAKDLGVELGSLTGTSHQGSITREVVSAASKGGSETVSGAPTSSTEEGSWRIEWGNEARERREPIKGVRKMMGQAMVDSAFSAPHVTEWVTIDVTRTMEFVDRLKARREFRDVKVSPLLVLARACMLAVRRTPEIDSFWDEPAQEIVFKSYVNLGIAAATPHGLVVPNVKDAERFSLLELAGALNQLAATAREGRTQPAEMSGGTFTITNVGVFGVDAGTPIINPASPRSRASVRSRSSPGRGRRDRRTSGDPAGPAFDHRHVDGEKGSRFLSDVAAMMEDPAAALLF